MQVLARDDMGEAMDVDLTEDEGDADRVPHAEAVAEVRPTSDHGFVLFKFKYNLHIFQTQTD